jgi:hypothetical protein
VLDRATARAGLRLDTAAGSARSTGGAHTVSGHK